MAEDMAGEGGHGGRKAVARMNSLRLILVMGARHHLSNCPRSNPGSDLSPEDIASSQVTRSREAADCRAGIALANRLLKLLKR